MKFLTIMAFVTAALAKPYGIDPGSNSTGYNTTDCTAPSYACKDDSSGWLVCNIDGIYIDGGDCPPDTECKPINDLPYCI